MPEFFRKAGYFTTSAGKLYHDGMDDPASWSYPSNQTAWIVGCMKGDICETDPATGWTNYIGVTAQSQIPITDEDLALAEGLRRMDLAHASGKPWWVSIGVHRPHSPFRLPEGYHGPQQYPNGSGDVVALPGHPYPPEGAPYMSGNWHLLMEPASTSDIHDEAGGCPTCIVPSARAREYRRWYYAAVTWMDYSLGRALAKLDQLGAAGNTITVFHADHGYQLGELNEWAKKTNTELCTHVPLLIRVPWKGASVGKHTAVKAELVDIYRTLAELAGLDGVEASVQGTSLAGVFDSPTDPPAALQEKAAFSQIARCACRGGYKGNSTECAENACCGVVLTSADFNFMAYSMRTAEWRYTAWVPWDTASLSADWSRLGVQGGQELYDLANDTGRDFDFPGYSTNLAADPAYSAVAARLLARLRAAVESWNSVPDPPASNCDAAMRGACGRHGDGVLPAYGQAAQCGQCAAAHAAALSAAGCTAAEIKQRCARM